MIRTVFLFLVKHYFRLGMFFYYRRIRITGAKQLIGDRPTLILGNHQNALMDPLLIALTLRYYANYLTRASVFKRKLIHRLLKLFNMMPVYRIRDGWKQISRNNAIFDDCVALLKQNQSVVMFPEGGHNLVRRVRPLSKGFTRIVFSALDQHPDMDLQLVPVGFSYCDARYYPDSVSIHYGQPIPVNPLLSGNRHEDTLKLKAVVHEALVRLSTHIPEEGYDDTLQKLLDRNIDLSRVDLTKRCIHSEFNDCPDVRISPIYKAMQELLKLLLKLNLIPPYVLWRFYVRPKIKELEFLGTFRFAVAVVAVPIYLLLVLAVLSSSYSFTVAGSYVLGVLLLGLLTTKL